ncbi:alpha/beta fold hydrolase [Glycomyces harbinensis]|uniref:Alpha/beta hydrolase fold n=1 Tax=Glycomyces harbinensis TaxID=58114 RepID=A0A1G6R638_9ACTN|nr:alpha/beta fold hydrolase [Glycomyces harbinensis]SDD00092.1 alpha/beta hydrolase fold [Glycomyces harbinensis]
MRTTRTITAATAAALLAVTLLAAAPAAAGSGGARHGIDWQPCPDLEPGQVVECATITVPLDYDRPRGEQIEIGLARREATNPDERLGTILMDPGGPGGSGVDYVMGGNPLTAAAAERFDIVGFDPRGVNTSTQVLCGEAALAAVEAIGIPTDQDSFGALEDANAALTADCKDRTGSLFDHVSNLETVEDMERIRRALGEGDLNYLGYSYGTIMGQQYAEAYPRHIRTMVLDGNMDHSLESVWDFMSTETAPLEENFAAFAEWCGSAPECALHGEDVESVYAGLKAAARAGELIDPYTGEPLDFYGLAGDFTFGVNFPQFWSYVALDYQAMRDGTPLSGARAYQDEIEVESLSYPAWCQDFNFAVEDYAEFAALTGKLSAEYPVVEWTPYNAFAMQCVGSGIEQTNGAAELDVHRSAPPLVFLGNLHDYATVYSWTEASSEQADGHLVTYEGYGHTIYGGPSACVNAPVDAYFIDREVPQEGLSCPNLDFPEVESLTDRRTPAGRY